jgi:hypothetical protein
MAELDYSLQSQLINPKIDRVKKREVDVFDNGSNQTGMVLFRISADAL